jgi:ACS family hexuronate transporter-like MFS transporter
VQRDPVPTRTVAWAVALVATLTMTVSYVDRVTLAVLAPTVTKALGISELEYGWLTSAFSIAYLVATPLSGWWIDRAGARRGLVASVLLWSSVAALHALVPGFAVLFALRIALGLAEGPGFPGAAQTVQRILPPAERARGFGVLFTGSSVGGMIAPLIATFLFRHGGWRFAFLGSAAVGLLWVPILILLTNRRDVRPVLDRVVDAPTAPKPRVAELITHPVIVRGLIAVFAAAPIVGFVQVWGAKYLVRAFGVTQGDVGDYLWLPPLIFDAGAILCGDLASRLRLSRPLFAIGIVLASAIALLPLAATPWQAMAIVAVAMAGAGALYTLIASDLFSRMPPGSVSFAGGVVAGGQSLALIVVNPLIGWSVGRLGSYDVAAVGLGLWILPGSLLWLVWRPAEKKP